MGKERKSFGGLSHYSSISLLDHTAVRKTLCGTIVLLLPYQGDFSLQRISYVCNFMDYGPAIPFGAVLIEFVRLSDRAKLLK